MIEALKANKLKPKLVSNEEGDLFLKISVSGTTHVQILPPMNSIEEAREYIDKIVPEMAKELYRKKRNRAKRHRKVDDAD